MAKNRVTAQVFQGGLTRTLSMEPIGKVLKGIIASVSGRCSTSPTKGSVHIQSGDFDSGYFCGQDAGDIYNR